MGILRYRDQTFIWIGRQDERHLPKNAGMRYAPDPRFYWWTRDWEVAQRLESYADADCAIVLMNMQGVTPVSIEASRATDADLDIPCPPGKAYMGFQRAGIAYAMERENTLIADEMGLGKTIQAIGFINANPEIKQVVVVCPASLKINWRRELDRWLVRPFGIFLVDKYFPHGLGATVRILNYDMLHRFTRQLTDEPFDLLICDEAHYGKNENARRSKAMHAIKAKRTLYLTGTPIVNRPKELWPLLKRLDPKTWTQDGWPEYRDRYCNVAPHTAYGAKMLNLLQNKLRSTVMVRRLKKDVLKDLPPKMRQVIELPAGSAAQAVAAEREAVQRFTDDMVRLKVAVEMAKASDDTREYAAAVTALKEGVGAWFGEMSKLRHETALAKVPAVTAHMREVLENDGKVVLFAHHHDVIDSYVAAFPSEAVKLDGTMNQRDRQAAVDAFQNDPKTRLFVGSIQAAGVGLTLTSAAHVVFGELDWTPGNMSQAEDRCHRIGQLDSVLVQHLVLEESLDATMAKTLVSKQAVIDAALDNERGELADVPLVPMDEDHAMDGISRQQVERDAESLSPQVCTAVHEALQYMVNVSGEVGGFNLIDAAIGRRLAAERYLTYKQAAVGRRIVRKYAERLPHETMEVIGEARQRREKEAVA